MRITHIITDLDTGGAELMLSRLLAAMDRQQFNSNVISLTTLGDVSGKIASLGISVSALGMNPAFPDPVAILRLAGWLRKGQPHLVQTWMYHADLAGGIAGRLAGGLPVVWGIRNSILKPGDSKRSTILVVRMLARLSGWLPAHILSCSETARQVHIRLGYRQDKFTVIPNGYDLQDFHPDAVARIDVRQELGVAADALLVGLMARFNPYKDHHNFIQAASLLHQRLPEVHFLLCGEQVNLENHILMGWIKDHSLQQVCHLLGRRSDIPRLTAALDIAASSSYAEAFPNVVGEAMACGVPCVVTDVGDSALIVGDTGRVVAPRDPSALADFWQELLEWNSEDRQKLGLAARQRVMQSFSMPAIAHRYEQFYKTLIGESEPG